MSSMVMVEIGSMERTNHRKRVQKEDGELVINFL